MTIFRFLIAVFSILGILTFSTSVFSYDGDQLVVFYSEPSKNDTNDYQATNLAGADENKHKQTYDDMFSLYQPYLENISAYEPICFLVGVDPSESRFQFSFKYRFLNPGLSLVKEHQWIQGFHIAYTQTSFWDLDARSQPFKDTSYKPELFFLTPNLLKRDFGVGRIFFQTGYQHESNGREEDFSRSTNYLYLLYINEIKEREGTIYVTTNPSTGMPLFRELGR